METIEATKATPSRFWHYVVVFTLGLIIRIKGKSLTADGWGDWPDHIARAIMYGLIYSATRDKWQEGISEFIKTTLWMTVSLIFVFGLAPFLTNYFHMVVAYGISVLPIAISAIFYRNWQRRSQPFSGKVFFKELAFVLVCCFLFGLSSWLLHLVFPH